MGRRILLPSAAKVMSILMENIEGKSRFPAWANTTTDSPRVLFLMVVWVNVNWDPPGVALLVSMERLGKSLQIFFYFLAAGLLACMMS